MVNEKSVTGKAIVIGAGTMGSGIAAQLANAGWQVGLLDVAGPDPADKKTRNRTAQSGLERIRTSKPPLLYLPDFAERIRIGNVEDDLNWLRGADWVVEAVAEKMEIKRAVMAQIEVHAGAETVLSTNTSGLNLREMTAERSPAFKRRFLGTHFFNPPRYLKLIELIVLPETDPALADGFTRFAERVLGRRVVRAKDTPGFISNRIGMWHLFDSIHTALDQALTVEEVDYLTGTLLGRPRSATFRLADIIGFDIMADIARNQVARLTDDPFRDRLLLPDVLQRLMAEGRKGEKSGAGFYKREGKAILALDFKTLSYRPQQPVRIAAVETLLEQPLVERFAAIRAQKDTHWGHYLHTILVALLAYTRHVAPEIADDALAIDRVMQWGFHWELGPLEIGDLRQASTLPAQRSFGGTETARTVRVFAKRELQPLPDPPEYLSLAARKAAGKTVLETSEASLIDLGEGVACLEFHTKMNTLTPALTESIEKARVRAEQDFAALVVGSQGRNFSAGFDLTLLLESIEAENWTAIETMMRAVQNAFQGLKYARIPTVAAPYGYTLGGGCECTLHCRSVQAAAEVVMGLPETTLGVIPVGGGIKEMLARAMEGMKPDADPLPAIERAFDLIAFPKNATSAHEAQAIGLLRETDGITLNPDRLLYEARERALGLANAGHPPFVKKSVRVMGEETLARLRMKIHWRYRAGMLTDHDRLLADRVAYVLSGGALPYAQEVDEDYLLHLEREVFLQLVREPKTAARIRHMLETGKPLKN
jgi:3-hydroxyacyl-CoA dehydrogenase